MFRNYLIVAWRNVTRNKLYAAINIIGLAIGMAACMVILLFVFYEKSFDSMHHRNLYRLNVIDKFTSTGIIQKRSETSFRSGPRLKAEFPEVLSYARVEVNNQYELRYEEKGMFLPRTYFADSSFLRMFDFPLLRGDRQIALQAPNSIVLTESAARKLFGTVDAMGKTVSHYGRDTLLFTVTGILKDVPVNSQFQFDALQSFNTPFKSQWNQQSRDDGDGNTYLELAANSNMATLEKQFSSFLIKRQNGKVEDIQSELFLLPLQAVHANAADILHDEINFQKFDEGYTNILMAVGILVLLIACINFMNLSTARSAERGKEVGIRKTIGASRPQLGVQFLGESVLVSVMAMLIAFLMVGLALPYIDQLSGRRLSPIFFVHPELLGAVFIGTILLGLLSGLYPAIYLSAFQPVKVLKGLGDAGKGKGTFRNILVVGQFASAIFLMIATVFVFRQLRYMEKQDPGFDRDQLVTIPLHGITSRKYALLKDQLSTSPLITGVTGAQDELGGPLTPMGFGFWPGNKPMQVVISSGIFVDPDYISVYKIQVLAGRNFSPERSAFTKEWVINETLARQLLKDEPGASFDWLIGKHLGDDTSCRLVGICKDFNFNSLHYKIEPLFLLDQGASSFSELSVKVNGRQASAAIAFIESTWKKVLPEYPFEYQFLDDRFRELYRIDTQVSLMVAIMSCLAIVISCLGLFGLAAFSAEKRTKEIGIRKVLGASVSDVVLLLSRHFIGLVLIGNLIAWPLAWLALHRWVEGYAYRVAINWWVFVLAGVAALLIAWGTVSFLAIKAATNNPVKSLRTE